ncbi:MAG: carboxypeptidase regulatory-like domain-containing protein [Thermoanaerobaculia bacterium]
MRVVPEQTIRSFVWISADAAITVAGFIPAGASEVLLADEMLATNKLIVSPSDASRRIATSFELRCGESAWKWSLPRLQKQAMTLMHPAGDCKLMVGADGYKTTETALTAPDAGMVFLRRLPVISGSVIDAVTHTPIGRAEIFLPEGDLLATTDQSGRFRVPMDRSWPVRLRVEAIGRASHMVDVPKAIADVDLPIVLSAGGSVVVTLAPPLGHEAVQWEARRIIDDAKDEKVRFGDIAAGQSTTTVEGLEAGPYRIILLGEAPLQRIAVSLRVLEAMTVETTVEIEPARLELEVLRGGKPFGGAEVEFVFRDGPAMWRSKLSVDDEGRKAEEIWQRGDYLAAVSSWVDSQRLDSEGTVTWKLEVPDRIIRGRVTDAATGQPIANVSVSLALTDEGGDSMGRARSGADGVYEFKMVRNGSYVLRASLDGYEELRTPSALLAEDTVVETRDLAMRAASGPTVRAVNAVGMPLASVPVYVATRNGVQFAGSTNNDGRLTLAIDADDRGVAYVLPRSGSFGMVRFAPASESASEDVVVTVAEGNATLEVHAISTNGDPIGGMAFLMRVNGIPVPPEVKEALSRYQGWPSQSDASGRLLLSHIPPGRYEIWPLASREDYVAVMSPTPPPAPVNVTVTPGHQVAELTFQSK